MNCSALSTISEKTEVFGIGCDDQLSLQRNLCKSSEYWCSAGKGKNRLGGCSLQKEFGKWVSIFEILKKKKN